MWQLWGVDLAPARTPPPPQAGAFAYRGQYYHSGFNLRSGLRRLLWWTISAIWPGRSSVNGTIIGGDSNSPATGAGSRSGPSNAPLKARFKDVPAGHDGSTAFVLQIAFNEPIKTTEAVLQALTVTGGTVTSAQEVGGLSDRWEIIVTPNGNDDVRISLPPITSCDDEGAICSYDGKVLQRGVAVSVPRAPLTCALRECTRRTRRLHRVRVATCVQRTD